MDSRIERDARTTGIVNGEIDGAVAIAGNVNNGVCTPQEIDVEGASSTRGEPAVFLPRARPSGALPGVRLLLEARDGSERLLVAAGSRALLFTRDDRGGG